MVDIAPYGEGIINITKNGKISVNGKKTAIVNVPQVIHTNPYSIDITVKGPAYAFATETIQCSPSIDITVKRHGYALATETIKCSPSIDIVAVKL